MRCFKMDFMALEFALKLVLMVSANFNSKCNKRKENCPPGHEMQQCDDGALFYCKQCSTSTFQPNKNKIGDKCRIRKNCDQLNMEYRNPGSTIKDADCQCVKGNHFENEDQRACVPNRECDKGLGQGAYGRCEDCLAKNMYSDTKDRLQECIPLRNCEKEHRCTKKKSNGTFDNSCGPVVNEITICENMSLNGKESETQKDSMGLVVGCVAAALIVCVIVFILVYFCVIRPRSRTPKKHSPTKEQLKRLHLKVVDDCSKDEGYCKKVLATSFPIIEDRIDRQIWGLAQELFRLHPQPGKYEVLVEKYKGCSQKSAVYSYLSDWKSWKRETADAVTGLFSGLQKCQREDIIYEIVHELNKKCDETIDSSEKNLDKEAEDSKPKPSYMGMIIGTIFPCTEQKKRYADVERGEKTETTSKLLLEVPVAEGELRQTDGAVQYGPPPSAPVLEVEEVSAAASYYPEKEASYPIQASS